MELELKLELDKMISELGIDTVLSIMIKKRDYIIKLNVKNKIECTNEWVSYCISVKRDMKLEELLK